MVRRKVKVSGYRTKAGVFVKPSNRRVIAAKAVAKVHKNREAFNRDNVVSAKDVRQIEKLPGKPLNSRNTTSWVNLKGKRYLMKDNYYGIEAINEVIGSGAAKIAGIPCNNVKIIPNNLTKESNRTIHEESNRTIHEAVEGGVPFLDHKGNGVDKHIFDNALFGEVEGVLEREDASKIYALDAFFGHQDRHSGNVLYDKEKDAYTAIDNGLLVSRYSGQTRKDFKRHMEELDVDKLSPLQIKNLRVVDETVGKLRSAIPFLKTQATQTTKAMGGEAQLDPHKLFNNFDEVDKDAASLSETIKKKLDGR
jgi:hypothetical protein